jgi:chromosomal replication initiator protein
LNCILRAAGISIDVILCNTRRQESVIPRQVAQSMLRQTTTLSLTEIGRLTGGRDHATILHAGRVMRNEEEVYAITGAITPRIDLQHKAYMILNQ